MGTCGCVVGTGFMRSRGGGLTNSACGCECVGVGVGKGHVDIPLLPALTPLNLKMCS